VRTVHRIRPFELGDSKDSLSLPVSVPCSHHTSSPCHFIEGLYYAIGFRELGTGAKHHTSIRLMRPGIRPPNCMKIRHYHNPVCRCMREILGRIIRLLWLSCPYVTVSSPPRFSQAGLRLCSPSNLSTTETMPVPTRTIYHPCDQPSCWA
jgi:hypothetical protein